MYKILYSVLLLNGNGLTCLFPVQKKVTCSLTVKKLDQKVKWFAEYCIACDVDLELTGNKFKCPRCGKMKPYPDKRFLSFKLLQILLTKYIRLFCQTIFSLRYQVITLCSDHTGTIPVMWSDDEVTRLTGKTVYDLLADDVEVPYATFFIVHLLFYFSTII